ncbi:carboxymuconolactone decarboxylase family protein [Pyxidicoccus trucidator]|uniref:carboxymuconolactone decarboxylase family protein n=1 Tax=Pyxidicoccus trucidator TaxID=2709662 RepID=UPI0013D8EB79|nr:carboxymuconolactone decarboxylase family protein [Pyxidicoccus trucidator]
MQARMKNPAVLVPEAMQALMALAKCVKKDTLPAKTLGLIHLRVSQINGCAFCIDMHVRELQKAGETNERAFAVAAWRDSPLFNDAERAALALSEAVTRLNDRADPVSDEVWNEAARHYDEPALAQLVMSIATINFWNRLNVTTRQVAGSGW